MKKKNKINQNEKEQVNKIFNSKKSKFGDIVPKLADNFYLNIKNQNTPE